MDDEYSDSQRIDEMDTAEDYNRFEEHQLDLDNDFADDAACNGYEEE